MCESFKPESALHAKPVGNVDRYRSASGTILAVTAFLFFVATTLANEPLPALQGERSGGTSRQIQIIPVRERTIRKTVTTQIEMRRNGWDDDTISLWLPESVHSDFGMSLWNNGVPLQSNQAFDDVANGVAWSYDDERCRINCSALSVDNVIDVTCSVLNKTNTTMPNVYVQNCLHFPKAAHFSGKAGEHVFFRNRNKWVTMKSTQNWFDRSARLADTTKFCFRQETLQEGRYPAIRKRRNVDPERSDHPMIIIESKDRKRVVAFVGRSWDFVFHNTNPDLGCIHSQPRPVSLKPSQRVDFQQRIYFFDGDRNDLLSEHGKDALVFGNSENKVISIPDRQ